MLAQSLLQLALPALGTLSVYLIGHALYATWHNLTSPLRQIPGPRSPSWIFGNAKETMGDPTQTSRWRRAFGDTFVFRGLLNAMELYTADLKALNHILAHSDMYPRSDASRDIFHSFSGEGLLVTEGEQHKRQRRVMNPAFGPGRIRVIAEIFLDEAVKLRDAWTAQLSQADTTIDVLSGISNMALDSIGLAAFGYDFAAQNGKPNELSTTLAKFFHSPTATLDAMMRRLQNSFPILKLLPLPGWRTIRNTRTRLDNIGRKIVLESKAAILAEGEKEPEMAGRRDLLSILLRANMSADLPESQQLSDAEVIAQISTIVVAGQGTTVAACAWALNALSLNKHSQAKLREELLTIGTDNPTLDELNALPYLEKVVREVMRVHSPVTFAQLVARQDDVLPLATPVTDTTGRACESLQVQKGQVIHVPICDVNMSKEVWGDDTEEFRPERWDDVPAAATSIPTIWANLLTFSSGTHNCIGFRFALAEVKYMLFVVLRAFEIEAAVPKGQIVPVAARVIQRPAVLTENGPKVGLPLVLKAL